MLEELHNQAILLRRKGAEIYEEKFRWEFFSEGSKFPRVHPLVPQRITQGKKQIPNVPCSSATIFI